jgi:hypothetical protein
MSNTELKAFLSKIAALAGGFDITSEMIEETKSFLLSKTEKKEKAGKKEKSEKKDKDPNAPKKPTNAYIIYAKEMRPEIVKDTDIKDAKDIIREIARRWNEEKSNDSDVYKEYTQKLLDAKEKYTSEMEDYVPSEKEKTVVKKEKKEKKDSNAPKKPTNAYMIYAKEMRSEIANESNIKESKELVREIARRWNNEKTENSDIYKKYTQKLIDAKEKYESDMKNYSSEDEKEVVAPVKKAVKKVEKKIQVDDEVPEPPKKVVKKVVKKVEVDEDEVPEPPKKVVKKVAKKVEIEDEDNKSESSGPIFCGKKADLPLKKAEVVEDEDEVPEPPKKASKKTVKK